MAKLKVDTPLVAPIRARIERASDSIEDGHPANYEFFKLREEAPETLITTIYVSKAENPPTRRDESVKVYCKITWDINIDWDSLPIYRNTHGKEYRRLDYTVSMKCDGGSSDCFILHNRRRQATKNVSVEVYENSDI